jgi:hypothetical protein
MKKNYKNLLLSLAIATISTTTQAQVSVYQFTQSSTTYSAITGGTVLGSTASDDQVFVDPAVLAGVGSGATGPGFNIGFTFLYSDIPFDRIGVNNNGWIFFGQSTLTPQVNSNSSSGYTGISATSTAPNLLQYRVAGLARDLQGQAGSSLRIQTIGTAPNQICVIQWEGFRKFAQTGDILNFQIRLYEATKIVEVVYGNFVNGTVAGLAEVGLRGASNADYNNRNVNATNTWSASIAGVTNNISVNFNNTGLVPASGQLYRWEPIYCNGAPASNTAVSIQTLICPNANVNLFLANTYSTFGLSYQWLSSTTSAVGPFAVVNNATNATFPVVGQTVTTWYQVAITCAATSNTTISGSGGVFVAGTTTNSVPYNEGFEGIVLNNQLPNCSWLATSPGTVCQTFTTSQLNNRIPRTGSKYASFRFGTNANGDYFYSSGIQMEPGITYSAAVWYITDGNVGWSNLSLMLGASQTTTGLMPIASVGPASGQFYQLLSNTITVSTSGIYYLAIRCTANSTPQFLTFDDISVTVPCSLNAPALNVSTSATNICNGSSIILNASGANSYLWNTGSSSSSITVAPPVTTQYNVIGTSNLTGCTTTGSLTINVSPSPNAVLFAPTNTVCIGSSVVLYGLGGNNYSWNTGGSGASIVVSPTTNTSYSVIVTGNNGCSSTASVSIGVKPLPIVFAQSTTSGTLCLGENVTLIASGAGLVTYTWSSNNINITTQQAIVSPNISTIYTLSATNSDGCTNKTTINQFVDACTSIGKNANTFNNLKVFPNPTNGKFIIETGSISDKTIVISDLTGRVVSTLSSSEENVELNLTNVANGIYYAKVSSANTNQVIKIIKE